MSLECEHGCLARSCPTCEMESDLVAAQDRIRALEGALRKAADGFEEALPYIDSYFRDKWSLDDCLTEVHAALHPAPAPGAETDEDLWPPNLTACACGADPIPAGHYHRHSGKFACEESPPSDDPEPDWRAVGDGAFARPFGTVRVCRVCGCLVAGGPTACVRCVRDEEARERTAPTPKTCGTCAWNDQDQCATVQSEDPACDGYEPAPTPAAGKEPTPAPTKESRE